MIFKLLIFCITSICPSVQNILSLVSEISVTICVPLIPIEALLVFKLKFSGDIFPIFPVIVLNTPLTIENSAFTLSLFSNE